ncbi:MAG: cbb3-type cytochrome oxidase maturation protein [Paraglaciecola sp.]|jgi:cbb3-type cytochrome oxidase maturation protein
MEIIYILIPIAILLVCVAIIVFFWAVKSNQFEDLERHGSSILFDDDIKPKSPAPVKKSTDDNHD